MTPVEYQEAVGDFDNHVSFARATPFALGLAAEAGEVANLFERATRAGWPGVDTEDLRHELGDVLWNVAMLCNHYGLRIEDVMAANIAKLTERYASR